MVGDMQRHAATCSDMRASAAACTTAPGVCNPKRAIHVLCGSLNGRDALTTRSWTSGERHLQKLDRAFKRVLDHECRKDVASQNPSLGSQASQPIFACRAY